MIDLYDIDEEDALGNLEDLFEDLSIDGPTDEQLYVMYGHFLNDIVRNPLHIKGVKLGYNSNKSRHPICRGKMQSFEHIITRDSKYKGKRDFDHQRANKVHWVRVILENIDDVRIKYFEQVNDKGYNQQFYWYQEKGFIVIIRELNPELFLITAFCVDKINYGTYKYYYDEYRKKKT